MPSVPIRLLQISDLLLGKTRPQDVLEFLREGLTDSKQDLWGKIDYICVCGNLTHNSGNFKWADDLLRSLAGCLRDNRYDNRHQERILIVPGKHDVLNTDTLSPDYTAFQAFHDSFYQQQIAADIVHRFQKSAPFIRQLVDLTLVGVQHLNPRNAWGEVIGTEHAYALNRLIRQVRTALNTHHYPPFRRYRPLILVSAETPLLDWGTRSNLRTDDNLRAFELFDLCLFGAAPVIYLRREPFGLKCESLGTGPRSDADVWPMRFNCIEIQKTCAKLECKPHFNITAYRRDARDTRWKDENFVTELREEQEEDIESSYLPPSYISYLQNELHNARSIYRVVGLTGRWLTEFPERLKRTPLNGFTVVDLGVITSYGGGQVEDKLREVDRRTKKIKNPVVTIVDQAFSSLADTTEAIKSAIDCQNRFAAARHGTRILYVNDSFDQKVYLGRGDDQTLDPPHLDSNDMEQLMSLYSRRAPFHHAQVSALTGGYFDLTTGLLRMIAERAGELSGTHSLRPSTGFELLKYAVEHEALRYEASVFLSAVKKIHAATDVCDHIRRQLGSSQSDLQSLAANPLTIDLKTVTTSRKFFELHMAAQKLVKYDVLRERADGQFDVLEKVPFFLDATENRIMPNAPYVFISYKNGEADTQRDRTAMKLRSLNVRVHTDQDAYNGQVNTSLDTQIKMARCVVIIWTKAALASNWVLAEAEKATRDGKAVQLLDGVEPDALPVPFSGQRAYKLDDEDKWVEAVDLFMRN